MSVEREVRMIDIIQSENIEIRIDNKFIWINVDGICRFRGSLKRCIEFSLQDDRGRTG